MIYAVASAGLGLALPRLENTYFPRYVHDVSVGAALAFFSAVGSGMIALTGIVFSIAFVMVQFSAVVYSPRLVMKFGNNPWLFHALGIFVATFSYSLAALVWTDRGGSGTVPLFSAILVVVLLVLSMVIFARLIQGISDLQIQNMLQTLGRQGRAVIRAMFPELSDAVSATPPGPLLPFGPAASTQQLVYSGEPRAIVRFDVKALVQVAEAGGAVVTLESAVGDTVVEDTLVLRVYGAAASLPQRSLMRAIQLGPTRTYEQDPKYAIRLLVDIAIRALSPAVNDPTTAVQALDQIEDLLRHLGNRRLDIGHVYDARGTLRLIFPTPSWEDYLALSFDEIRQFGATSVQVTRRLRAALSGLIETTSVEERRVALRRYLDHLNRGVARSLFDDDDKTTALKEDRQGIGLSRTAKESPPSSSGQAGEHSVANSC